MMSRVGSTAHALGQQCLLTSRYACGPPAWMTAGKSTDAKGPHASACPHADLEGLVAHEDVTIHGEAELALLEEALVRLQVLAVCKHACMWYAMQVCVFAAGPLHRQRATCNAPTPHASTQPCCNPDAPFP